MPAISSTSMCHISPEILADFCAKYGVPYKSYVELVSRICTKLSIKDTAFTPVAPDAYSNINTMGTDFINLTYEQFSQMCIFVRSHSPLGARLRIPQVLSKYAESYPDTIMPCDFKAVHPDVSIC